MLVLLVMLLQVPLLQVLLLQQMGGLLLVMIDPLIRRTAANRIQAAIGETK
jgi:hypothetical protein